MQKNLSMMLYAWKAGTSGASINQMRGQSINLLIFVPGKGIRFKIETGVYLFVVEWGLIYAKQLWASLLKEVY